VTLTVTAAPPVDPPDPTAPSIDITLAPLPLRVGQQSWLTWTLHNVASLLFDNVGNGLDPRALDKTIQGVLPGSTGVKSFAWELTGTDGTVVLVERQWTALAAGDPGTDPPPPETGPKVTKFTVTPAVFTSDDEELTLTWETERTVFVSISHGVGEVNLSDFEPVSNPGTTTTYTLTAIGEDGSTITATATATFLPGPRPGDQVYVADTPDALKRLIGHQGQSTPVKEGDTILVKPMEIIRESLQPTIQGVGDKRILVITEQGWRSVKVDIGGDGDGNFNSPALDAAKMVSVDWVGFRLTSSSQGPRSIGQSGSWQGSVLNRGDAFYCASNNDGQHFGRDIRLIGCYIDNTRNGATWGSGKQIMVLDSCYVKHVGWKGGDRTHGPGAYGKGSSDPELFCLITDVVCERPAYYGPRMYGSGTETETEPASCYNAWIHNCISWNAGEAWSPDKLNPNVLIDVQFRDQATGRIRGGTYILAVPNGVTAGPWWERYKLDGWNLSTSVSGTPVWKDRLDIEENLVIGSDKNGATIQTVGYKTISARNNVSITEPDGNHLETNFLTGPNAGHVREYIGNKWYGGRSIYKSNLVNTPWDSAMFGPIDPVIPQDTRVRWIANNGSNGMLSDHSVRAMVCNLGCLDVVPLNVKEQGFNAGDYLRVWNTEDYLGEPVWEGVLGSDHIVPLPAKLNGAYKLPTGTNLSPGWAAMKSMAPAFLPIEVQRRKAT
jgi:hypothetical protein